MLLLLLLEPQVHLEVIMTDGRHHGVVTHGEGLLHVLHLVLQVLLLLQSATE